jgi:Putative zincin peptidase
MADRGAVDAGDMADRGAVAGDADGFVSEWRPTRATLLRWSIPATVSLIAAWFVYGDVAWHGSYPDSGVIGLGDIALEVGLIVGMAVLHEAIHGIVARAFGARPEFGVLKIGGLFAGFYTTAPGHRFGRGQYLAVCLAPLAVITPLGIPACLLPFGPYLASPLAVVFAGNIGDLAIARHVLAGPTDVLYEDLQDGLRVWKATAQRRTGRAA